MTSRPVNHPADTPDPLEKQVVSKITRSSPGLAHRSVAAKSSAAAQESSSSILGRRAGNITSPSGLSSTRPQMPGMKVDELHRFAVRSRQEQQLRFTHDAGGGQQQR